MKTLRGPSTGTLLTTCAPAVLWDGDWGAGERVAKRLSGISCMIVAETGVDPGGRVETAAIVTLVDGLFVFLVV